LWLASSKTYDRHDYVSRMPMLYDSLYLLTISGLDLANVIKAPESS